MIKQKMRQKKLMVLACAFSAGFSLMKTATAQTQVQLDVHQLISGLYMLVISDDKGVTQSIRWMKE